MRGGVSVSWAPVSNDAWSFFLLGIIRRMVDSVSGWEAKDHDACMRYDICKDKRSYLAM